MDELEVLIPKILFDTDLKDSINSGCKMCSCNIYVTKLTWDLFIVFCFCLSDSVLSSTNFIYFFPETFQFLGLRQ